MSHFAWAVMDGPSEALQTSRPVAVYQLEATAIWKAQKRGGFSYVKRVPLVEHAGMVYGPVTVQSGDEADRRVQREIDALRLVFGLQPEDELKPEHIGYLRGKLGAL